jgi:phosphohistidine phosphatase
MMLLLIRHGPAGDREAWRALGKDDFLRPLTADGRARTRAAAKGLARIVDRPQAIATSPLARAIQTADHVAKAFGVEAAEELHAILPEGSPADVVPWLTARAKLDLVALVGHEPQLGRLARRRAGHACSTWAGVPVPGALASSGCSRPPSCGAWAGDPGRRAR